MNAQLGRWSLVLLATLTANAAAADSPVLAAELECQRASRPGRILCELSTRAQSGKLVWSDALVVRAPEFARPLRSRFVAQLDPSGAASASAKLALVAASAGQGKLELLARAVVCRAGSGRELVRTRGGLGDGRGRGRPDFRPVIWPVFAGPGTAAPCSFPATAHDDPGRLLGALHRACASGTLELVEVEGVRAGRSHRVYFDAGWWKTSKRRSITRASVKSWRAMGCSASLRWRGGAPIDRATR